MTVLLEQQIALEEQILYRNFDQIGLISSQTNTTQILQKAIEKSSNVCKDIIGKVPKVDIIDKTKNNFPYVPSHLSCMLVEILKNSMRSTIESQKTKTELSKIKVEITDEFNEKEICIKITDKGNGISKNSMKHIWSYLYTTIENTSTIDDESLVYGSGSGLPVAKCYAQYFGGDLKIDSIEGKGTEVCLFLNRLVGANENPLE